MRTALPNRLNIVFIFLLFFVFSGLFAQESARSAYPLGYFRSPIDFTPSLSGAFAEIRSGHFHSGIDYRTQGVEGKPLYAAADGFVSRIRISPTGFGKALYIEHPNGYTTVYAHVRNFIPEIQHYIVAEQYNREAFDVDLYPEPKTIRVKKGDVIGWSGNSGSSSGPHLHFEIRHTHNQNPVNPKLFGLNIFDNVPPVIQAIKVYPANSYTTVMELAQSSVFEVQGNKGSYTLTSSKPLSIAGDVAFGVQAYDTHNHSNLRNGISAMKIYVDEELLFAYRIDEFSFSETRFVNAVIDYEEFMRSKRRFIQTQIKPNNPLDIYPVVTNGGIFSFNEKRNYSILVEVEDTYGNKSRLRFSVNGGAASLIPLVVQDNKNKVHFRHNQINRFNGDDFYVEMPAGALYENIWVSFSNKNQVENTVAKIFQVHDIYTPVHRNYTLAIKPQLLVQQYVEKAVIVRLNQDNEWEPEGGTFKDGFITTSTRSFGTFSVMLDTIAPEIRPLNISNNKNIENQADIRMSIDDALSGIKSYRGTINGKWILMDYDPKNKLLVYEIDDRTSPGENNFRLEVEDNVGNKSVYQARLIR